MRKAGAVEHVADDGTRQAAKTDDKRLEVGAHGRLLMHE
jgi:hypothetical protein